MRHADFVTRGIDAAADAVVLAVVAGWQGGGGGTSTTSLPCSSSGCPRHHGY
jgi:hypothetical protein